MHQFGIQILEPNSNSNKREEMKNKIEKEEKGCRPCKPPRLAWPTLASQPNRPANPSRLPSVSARPTSQPSTSPTPTHPSTSLAATAHWTPRVSHTPVYSVVFLTHASTGARQWWQGGPGVVTPWVLALHNLTCITWTWSSHIHKQAFTIETFDWNICNIACYRMFY